MSLRTLPRVFWQLGIALAVGLLLWFLWQGLFVKQEYLVIDEQEGREFPNFNLASVANEDEVDLKALKGKVHLVHIFASWCSVCMDEHATWMAIKNKYPYEIVGVAYRDETPLIKSILEKKGDPYSLILNDANGTLGLDLGLVGVPETYVVDSNGKIRLHQLGALSLEQFEAEFAPLLTNLSKEA